MVDVDKLACEEAAKRGFRAGLWPESYITWEFLVTHPKAMEPGYLSLNWNHIPGLLQRKEYLRTLAIPTSDLERILDPNSVETYWEPTQEAEDFHTGLALIFCRDQFDDATDDARKGETIVMVTIVRKLSRFPALSMENASVELLNNPDQTPVLLVVRLHRKSLLFPDVYYHQCRKHFALIHDTGCMDEELNVGFPRRYIGGELHSSYEPGKDHSPRAKLPPSWRDEPRPDHPIDSCTREYHDWTTGYEGASAPEVLYVWLSAQYTSIATPPGHDVCLPDTMLGVPPVESWPV